MVAGVGHRRCREFSSVYQALLGLVAQSSGEMSPSESLTALLLMLQAPFR